MSLLSVIYAECNTLAHYAESRYAECRYAGCRDASKKTSNSPMCELTEKLLFNIPSHIRHLCMRMTIFKLPRMSNFKKS